DLRVPGERRGQLLRELGAELAARVGGLRPRDVEAHRALGDGLLACEAVKQGPRQADGKAVQILLSRAVKSVPRLGQPLARRVVRGRELGPELGARRPRDRKSTRLNSSHERSSYAAVCFDKKNRL